MTVCGEVRVAGTIVWITPSEASAPVLAAGWQLLCCEAAVALQQLPAASLLIVDIASDAEVQALAAAYPSAVRLLTVPDCRDELLLPHLHRFHLFYPEPLAADALPALIDCMQALQQLQLPAQVRQQLLQHTHLPLLPPVLQQLQQLLQDPDVRIDALATVLEQDPVLTAKLLRLANSAYMGFMQETASVQMAVSRLGLNLLDGMLLVLAAAPSADDSEVTQSCLQRAECSRKLAQGMQLSAEAQDQAFLAALFHGLGHWLLAQSDEPCTVTAAQAGAFMLTLWGFSAGLAAALLEGPASTTEPVRWQGAASVTACVGLTDLLLQSPAGTPMPVAPSAWQLDLSWPALSRQYGLPVDGANV